MKDFFNKNNIQGHRGGKFAICLEYEGKILMAYMIGKAFFGKGKYEYEVIRRSYRTRLYSNTEEPLRFGGTF